MILPRRILLLSLEAPDESRVPASLSRGGGRGRKGEEGGGGCLHGQLFLKEGAVNGYCAPHPSFVYRPAASDLLWIYSGAAGGGGLLPSASVASTTNQKPLPELNYKLAIDIKRRKKKDH